MRPALLVAAVALALLALPSASAARCPPVCVTAGVETSPTGVSAHAGTLPPTGCYDCDTVGAAASVQQDGDGTTVAAKVCKGGFVYFCPVDEELTV